MLVATDELPLNFLLSLSYSLIMMSDTGQLQWSTYITYIQYRTAGGSLKHVCLYYYVGKLGEKVADFISFDCIP